MSTPRDYVQPAAAFGRSDRVAFRLPLGRNLHGLLGAVVQHYLALRAREIMLLQELSSVAVGRRAGLEARTVENVLGGQSGMTLQLAGALLSLGGPAAWPHPENMHRLVMRASAVYGQITGSGDGRAP